MEDSTGRIHIKMGKGKKDRVIFCSPEFFKELKSMNAKFNLKVNIYVFPSSTGSKVDINTLQKMIKSKCIKLGFKKRVYFHLFRHTYLTKIYEETNNICLVQEIAGHSDISTTMIYTHISSNMIRDVMLKKNRILQ
ncbi:tyrosine-type recombinase/integrase [Borreliella bavariensis]|uniref:tyrosine-type recombinase/integrase n=1 Tax=Borreliella bavariensis TaxID=664662 RepID=UPI002D7F74FF|nr:tyrosine-type recombinase/integrase [Borreliella bavariensis]